MKEDDIRPSLLQAESVRLAALDAGEMLKMAADFVAVYCPACDADDCTLEFTIRGYEFRRCTSCRTLYVSPRPTAKMLDEYYTASSTARFTQGKIYPKTRHIRIENIHRPRAEMIISLLAQYAINPGIIMDVGAGSGDFGIELAKKQIFKRIILIEPQPISVSEDYDIEIINDVVDNINLRQKPDIITNFEFIEHLYSPIDFVRSVHRLMGKGSVFVFSTPNIEGFDLLTLGEKSDNITGPSHLNYFSPASIKILLQRAGFVSVAVTTPGKLDADIVRNKCLEGAIDLARQPFLDHILMQEPELYLESFQAFLQQNSLSSHMLVVTRI